MNNKGKELNSFSVHCFTAQKRAKKTMQAAKPALSRQYILLYLFFEFCTHLCSACAFGSKNVLSVVYSLEA